MAKLTKPAPQQVNTIIWAAGRQDISISSHNADAASWVAVRVGQVITYADDLAAAESIAHIWAQAHQRAAALLPEAVAIREQTDMPGVVAHLRGEQVHDRHGFPYDGRAGSAHILIGGILWRPIDRTALTAIADAWQRAAAIARILHAA